MRRRPVTGRNVRNAVVAALAGVLSVAALLSPGVASASTAKDTVWPVIDSVSSPEFPPPGGSPGTGVTGTPGHFTITMHDVGGGLRRVEWLLGGEFSTGGIPPNGRFSGWWPLGDAPSASVTVTVTPPSWGTSVLGVRAVDRAGHETTYLYTFYVPSNPDQQVSAGDVTGDGVPDVVAADLHGDLRVFPGRSDGGLATSYVASSAAQSPSGDGWGRPLVAHRGALNGAVDDLWVLDRALYVYRNDGVGDFTSDHVSVVVRPGCPGCQGYRPDWSGVTSMVMAGDLHGNGGQVLLTIEDGRVWAFSSFLGRLTSPTPVPLDGLDLSHADVVAPGDVDGDGRADLWVRDRVSGRVTQFAGAAGGVDPLGTVVVWKGLDAASYPVVTSVGDLSGDSVPDLLTLTAAGLLQSRPATAPQTITRILPPALGERLTRVEGQATAAP